MPFLALPALVVGGYTLTVGAALMMTASIGYQMYQSNKMKNAQKAAAGQAAAAAEARKGFEVTRRSTVENLPVVYGANKLGSLVTDLRVSNQFNYTAPRNFEPADRIPETGFLYDANNYIEVEAVGTSGTWVPKLYLTDILQVTQVTYKVVWNGVTVYTNSKDVGPASLGPSFFAIRQATTYFDDGTFRYISDNVPRTQTDTVYRYGLARQDFTGSNTIVFNRGLNSTQSGDKKEFMYTQNAIAFGGISDVVDMDIDDNTWRDAKYGYGLRANIYPDGNVADTIADGNGFELTNIFTNTFYATCAFKLNRDDPQFSGIPSPTFYVHGQKIKTIESANGAFSSSTDKTYSANPARILYDYLTDDLYGRGLAETQLDLESFYNAQEVCDQIVMSNAVIDGKIYGGPGLVAIKRYEFNGIIDTSNPVRNNVEQILESMGQSVLVWSGGVYKLKLDYPSEQPSVLNGHVDASHVFNDEHIVAEEITMTYPKAEDKFNQITVKFPNAYKDFKSDSVTWPPRLSQVHLDYLAEDNQQPLKGEISVPGLTNPYHALAKAEEMVRLSRSSHVIRLQLSREVTTLEPGDFFILSSEIAQINNEVYRAEAVRIGEDFTVDVEAYSFNFNTLAWNIADDVSYSGNVIETTLVQEPVNALFDASSTELLGTTAGKITWTAPESAAVTSFVVEVSSDNKTTWNRLGETSNTEYFLPAFQTGTYSFRIRSKTVIGGMSIGILAVDGLDVDLFTIQRQTTDQMLVIYADTGDETTNTQSLVAGSNAFTAYYVYNGDTPILPIRTDIQFISTVGADGADGTIGSDGADGPAGERGAGWWRGSTNGDPSALDQLGITTVFGVTTGSYTPVVGDRLVISDSNETFESLAWIYNGSIWIAQAAFIDGNFVVNGTISGSKIVADTITGTQIAANTVTADNMNVTELSAITATLGTFQSAPSGERTVITDDSIKIYDANGILRVSIGNLL